MFRCCPLHRVGNLRFTSGRSVLLRTRPVQCISCNHVFVDIECYSCRQEAGGFLSVREKIWTSPGWRVAHAFNSSLAGWLVVLPTRHVESVDELTVAESEVLGNLLREVSGALRSVTGCLKTYVIMFAEAEGFSHLHFHVVPRMSGFSEDRVGPKVFAYLKEEPLSDLQRDEISLQVREALEMQLRVSED